MTPVELSSTVLRAVRRAVDAGELVARVPERAQIVRPGPGGRGDYATNVALRLARPSGRPPREVAAILRPHLTGVAGVTRVDITGPGFLNFTLHDRGQALVRQVLRCGARYGYTDAPTGELVRLHHPCEVRAAVSAQVLARILRSQGVLVRTACEAEPDPAWARELGVTVDPRDTHGAAETHDVHGTPDTHDPPGVPGVPAPHGRPRITGVPLDVDVRPVPAGEDPTRLGRDAARWALLHPAPHDRPRVTDEYLVQREDNPLFRVRYAHARTRALGRNAGDLGFHGSPGDVLAGTAGDPDGLHAAHGYRPHDAHAHAQGQEQGQGQGQGQEHGRGPAAGCGAGDPRRLVDALGTYPQVLATAALHRAPDRLARHLVVTADALLAFQHSVLPLGDEKPSAAHRARLALAEAAGTVLAGGLSLLGIDAPEHL